MPGHTGPNTTYLAPFSTTYYVLLDADGLPQEWTELDIPVEDLSGAIRLAP